MGFDLGDYKDVPTRIRDFKALYPDGCLRPADLEHPYRVETIGDQSFIVFVAAAFRTPDDQAPGIGTAWEPFPGKTPYTKDSELQNAETSAWGRAIVAVLASESKSIASYEDVQNRQPYEEPPPPPLPEGWESWDQLVEEWETLREATKGIADEALREDVKAWVKEQGFTRSTFTPMQAVEWGNLLPEPVDAQ